MQCYRDLADVYDKLINVDIDYALWANIIKEKCEKYNVDFKNYLDIACGTGNFTKELCKSFKRTWAIDLSEEMLTVAEEKFREEGLKAKFICQNMSDIAINEKFDLITCCLDSTNYLLEDKELTSYLSSVYKLLKDDGIFVFDINSEYKLTKILGNQLYTYDDENIVYIWQNYLEDDILDMELTFFIRNGELYERFDEVHSERVYRDAEIEKNVSNLGFSVLEKLDNYVNNSLSENTERIVYILRKK